MQRTRRSPAHGRGSPLSARSRPRPFAQARMIGPGSAVRYNMLRYDFRPGAQQAREASRYLNEVAAEMIRAHLSGMRPRQYLLVDSEGSHFPLRIWNKGEDIADRLRHLMPWLRAQQTAAERFLERDIKEPMISAFVRSLLCAEHGLDTFFIEVLNPAYPFTPDECNELSVGVVGGRVAMLATRTVVHVELSRDLFGTSILGHGSIQCEVANARRLSMVA